MSAIPTVSNQNAAARKGPHGAVPAAPAADGSARLAAWAADLRWEAVPQAVRDTALRFLLDTFGVIAGAARAPGLDRLNRRLHRWESAGAATGLLGKYRYSPPTAALANGAAAHALDYDDQHDPARVHTNCVVVPALLATAEGAGAVSGAQFLLAWAIGAEVHARLGLACHSSLGKGWHPTMIYGGIAASLAAGRLLGLPAPALGHAMGFAYHQSGGSILSAQDGAFSKRIGPGFAARNAVTSAFLAADGITSTHRTFDAPAGLFALYERGEVDQHQLWGDLGTAWRVLEYSLKPFPCCRCNHTLIDIALGLHRKGVDPATVEAVELGLGRTNWQVVGAVYDPVRNEVAHAQFNAAYSFACAWTDGAIGLRHYRAPALTDARYTALAGRIRTVDDPAIAAAAIEPARVTVRFRDGTTRAIAKDVMKGSPGDPMSDADLAAKYFDCMTAGGAARAEAQRLWDAVMTLPASADAAGTLIRAFPDLPRYD
jgi:2-methylcitrate dehydratase PrpD